MIVEEYIKEDGSSPYEKWFNSLNTQASIKVITAKTKMALGNISNIKWFDGIGEYKINWGPGYRIYLMLYGKKLIILFGGGTKKTQQADIKKAKKLCSEFKIRKMEAKKNKGVK